MADQICSNTWEAKVFDPESRTNSWVTKTCGFDLFQALQDKLGLTRCPQCGRKINGL